MKINRVMQIVNNVNERWSIYRSLFICKNEMEANEVFLKLFENGFPVSRHFLEPKKCRILVNTLDSLDLTLDFEEFNVFYTTCKIHENDIHDIIKKYKIRCITIL